MRYGDVYFYIDCLLASKIISYIWNQIDDMSKIKDMNRIKEVLQEKGIKQTWLAEKLGKSFKMVNNYANNRIQPSLETLHEIAKILQVEVKELIK